MHFGKRKLAAAREEIAALTEEIKTIERNYNEVQKINYQLHQQLINESELVTKYETILVDLDDAVESLPISVQKWKSVARIVKLMNDAGREIDFRVTREKLKK